MEIAEHIAIIADQGKRLAAAAEEHGMEADIPACPGWVMRDLVRHLAEIHLWASARIDKRTDKLWLDDRSELLESWPDLAEFWPDDNDLVAYYLDTNANLVRVLEAAPDDLECPTFLPAPSPKAMWARRQAHETAVHRYDAEAPGPDPAGYDPVFASDGVDELIMGFMSRKETFPIDTAKTMHVHATDTNDHWMVTMGPDGVSATREAGEGDVTLSGSASDIYLGLWNRTPDTGLVISGEADVVEAWHGNNRVRWDLG